MDLRMDSGGEVHDVAGPKPEPDRIPVSGDIRRTIAKVHVKALEGILKKAVEETGIHDLEWRIAGAGADKVVVYMVSRSRIPHASIDGEVYNVPKQQGGASGLIERMKDTRETLVREAGTIEQTKTVIEEAGIDLGASNLALDWAPVEGHPGIYRCPRGVPYEKAINPDKRPENPNEDLRGVEQLMRGLANGVRSFHKAGHTVGDIKPDNAIVVGGKTLLIDFGKARMGEGDYNGNPRTAGFSWRQSKPDDVTALAITLNATLEKRLLQKRGGRPMLDPGEGPYRGAASRKREGIERWLCEDGSQPAFETVSLKDKISGAWKRLIYKRGQRSPEEMGRQQEGLHRYFDAVRDGWALEPGLGQAEREHIRMWNLLTKAMAQVDSSRQPTMDEVMELIGYIEAGDKAAFYKGLAPHVPKVKKGVPPPPTRASVAESGHGAAGVSPPPPRTMRAPPPPPPGTMRAPPPSPGTTRAPPPPPPRTMRAPPPPPPPPPRATEAPPPPPPPPPPSSSSSSPPESAVSPSSHSRSTRVKPPPPSVARPTHSPSPSPPPPPSSTT